MEYSVHPRMNRKSFQGKKNMFAKSKFFRNIYSDNHILEFWNIAWQQPEGHGPHSTHEFTSGGSIVLLSNDSQQRLSMVRKPMLFKDNQLIFPFVIMHF